MIDGWQDRLRTEMERKEYSASRLSLDAGLSRNYVSQMLNDGKDPTLSNINKICDALGVSSSYIFFGTKMTKDDQELIRLMSGLPDHYYLDILDLIQKRLKLESR